MSFPVALHNPGTFSRDTRREDKTASGGPGPLRPDFVRIRVNLRSCGYRVRPRIPRIPRTWAGSALYTRIQLQHLRSHHNSWRGCSAMVALGAAAGFQTKTRGFWDTTSCVWSIIMEMNWVTGSPKKPSSRNATSAYVFQAQRCGVNSIRAQRLEISISTKQNQPKEYNTLGWACCLHPRRGIPALVQVVRLYY